MKRIIYNICLLILFSCPALKVFRNAVIQYRNIKQNLGVLAYHKAKEYSFKFEKPGESPLIIQNVKTSCGCTVANWLKRFLKPRKKGLIEIKYDTASPGMFHKTIEVFYNGPGSPAFCRLLV